MKQTTMLIPTADMLVSDLLDKHPALARYFVERRLDCLGCAMNRFCTLNEVSIQYEMKLESLIQQILERIQQHESNTNLNG